MKFLAMYHFISEKIKNLIFAEKIRAEQEAEAAAAARKKTVIIVCVCAGVALLAAAISVFVYLYLKNDKFNAKVKEMFAKIKSKLPFCKKTEEICPCEIDGDIIVEDIDE